MRRCGFESMRARLILVVVLKLVIDKIYRVCDEGVGVVFSGSAMGALLTNGLFCVECWVLLREFEQVKIFMPLFAVGQLLLLMLGCRAFKLIQVGSDFIGDLRQDFLGAARVVCLLPVHAMVEVLVGSSRVQVPTAG